MKFSIYFFILFVLMLGAGTSFGQTAQPGLSTGHSAALATKTKLAPEPPKTDMVRQQEEVATRMSSAVGQNVSLSASQNQKVHQACLDYVKAMGQHNSANPLTKALHDKYAADRDARIKGALTASQYSKYLATKRSN